MTGQTHHEKMLFFVSVTLDGTEDSVFCLWWWCFEVLGQRASQTTRLNSQPKLKSPRGLWTKYFHTCITSRQRLQEKFTHTKQNSCQGDQPTKSAHARSSCFSMNRKMLPEWTTHWKTNWTVRLQNFSSTMLTRLNDDSSTFKAAKVCLVFQLAPLLACQFFDCLVFNQGWRFTN